MYIHTYMCINTNIFSDPIFSPVRRGCAPIPPSELRKKEKRLSLRKWRCSGYMYYTYIHKCKHIY